MHNTGSCSYKVSLCGLHFLEFPLHSDLPWARHSPAVIPDSFYENIVGAVSIGMDIL